MFSLRRLREELDRVIRSVAQKLHFLSGMAVIAMMLLMSLDVIARYVLKSSILDTIEISSMLLGTVVCLSLVSITYEGEHVKFSVLTDRLSTRHQRLAKAIELIISAALFSVLTWQTAIRAISSLRSGLFVGSLQIPVWPIRFLFMLGCLLTALVLLTQLIIFFHRPLAISNEGGRVNREIKKEA